MTLEVLVQGTAHQLGLADPEAPRALRDLGVLGLGQGVAAFDEGGAIGTGHASGENHGVSPVSTS